MNWQHQYLVSCRTVILFQRAERTASTELANCGKLIHSTLLVCRRDELGMHQVVLEVGGAVMDNSGFFLENII